MKIIDAINTIDTLKHNTYTQTDKLAWLSTLDSMVKRQIIDTHEGADAVTFNGYDDSTDMDTELLVEAPFDEMYLRWLEAQIDYTNGEYGKYNNAILMYNTTFTAYKNHYNRTHKPLGESFKFF